jgi:hypothetical protein
MTGADVAQATVPWAPGEGEGGRDDPGPAAGRRGPVQLAGRYGAAVLGAAWVLALGATRLGRRPLWLDEAFTVGGTHDLVGTWRKTGGTMGLYYLLMWPVTQLSLDRAWLRLPSLLCAAATVVVVHEIGRMIGGRRVGAMATGLLAVMWALARFGLEARSYTLAMLLVSLSWLGLVGAVKAGADRPTRRRRWWALFAAATLLAPLAHGLAALHFASQLAVLGLLPNRRRWWRACLPVAAALAVEMVGLFAIGAGEVANWIAPLSIGQVGNILRVLLGEETRLALIGVPVAVAIVLAAADAWRGRSTLDPPGGNVQRDSDPPGPAPPSAGWLALVPVFWLAGVPLLIIAISVVRPYAEPRYVIGAVPGVALALAGLLARIRPGALAAAAWVVVALVLVTDQPRITPTGSEDWPSLVGRITADGHDGDRLLMPAMLRAPFDYAWAEDPAGVGDRPDLVPLSPTDGFDEVKRFYDPAPGGMRAQLRTAPANGAAVWYVDRDIKRLDDVRALIADPEVTRYYQVAGQWQLSGELYLVRFEPRSDAIVSR